MKKVLLATFIIFSATLSGCLSSDDADEKLSDSDSDGVTDDFDVFPQNALEWSDLDGDGIGDNADAYPKDANESMDSDGDDIGDNRDAFPQNSLEWSDLDGDGIGDNADAYPKDANESMDSDGDGFGDNGDVFPQDSSEWADLDGDGVGDNGDLCHTPRLPNLTSFDESVDDYGCYIWRNDPMGGLAVEPIISNGIYFSYPLNSYYYNTSSDWLINDEVEVYQPGECDARVEGFSTEINLIPGNVSVIDDSSPYPRDLYAIGHLKVSLILEIGSDWDYVNCELNVINNHVDYYSSSDGPYIGYFEWPIFSGIITDVDDHEIEDAHGQSYTGEILAYPMSGEWNSEPIEIGAWEWVDNSFWKHCEDFTQTEPKTWDEVGRLLPFVY